ncbi:MAG: tryptophan-rich sensory protein [Clostridium sp.]|uniref:TspO/MBR family protein n=1 Tax=Clostridium sp. TaxID=1506 RepID=UPI002A87184A|nr:tryptophan-rich sensory protein [Clostridium sp.]MDY5099050.1 TspO/MBR family protein [Clostridium sp.]
MKNKNKEKKKVDIGALIISLLISVGGGFIAGIFNKNSMMMYANLQKPAFSPPAILFPIVWTILYILMGIAAYRVYMVIKETNTSKLPLVLYGVQLLLNFLWPFLFFKFRLYGLAFIELVILFVFIILTTVAFFKRDKVAGILMIPYALWVAFAGVLNFFVWMLNEM